MAERQDFEGLNQGTFFRANRWRKDEEFNEERGSGARSRQPYDMLDDGRGSPDDEHVWYMPKYAEGGDYGGNLVNKSNYEVLEAEAQRLSDDELGGDDTWWQSFYGGHGSYGIAFHVDRTPDEILEMLNALEDYSILDEQKHSELEVQSQDEAWESTVKDEYRTALAEKFGGTAEGVPDEKLYEHFREAAEASNTYWSNEEGDTSYIDVERVVEGASEPPEGMRYYFCITYYLTDADDSTSTENWYVLAPDEAAALQSFEESVKGGDETIWGFSFNERPEHAGDSDYYVSVWDPDTIAPDATQAEIDAHEPDVHMIRIGKAEQVNEDDVDLERLTE